MKSSLKDKLYWAIRTTFPFEFNLNQIEKLAKEEGRKVSYAERELRHLAESKVIEPIYDINKRYIRAYKYVQVDNIKKKFEDQFTISMF